MSSLIDDKNTCMSVELNLIPDKAINIHVPTVTKRFDVIIRIISIVALESDIFTHTFPIAIGVSLRSSLDSFCFDLISFQTRFRFDIQVIWIESVLFIYSKIQTNFTILLNVIGLAYAKQNSVCSAMYKFRNHWTF